MITIAAAATFAATEKCLSAVCNATTAARVCEGTACSSGTCLSVFDCPYYGCAGGLHL